MMHTASPLPHQLPARQRVSSRRLEAVTFSTMPSVLDMMHRLRLLSRITQLEMLTLRTMECMYPTTIALELERRMQSAMTTSSQGLSQFVMQEMAMQSSPAEMLQPRTITPLQEQKCMPSLLGMRRSLSMVRSCTRTSSHSTKDIVQQGAPVMRTPSTRTCRQRRKKMGWLGRFTYVAVHSATCAGVSSTSLSGTVRLSMS